MSLEIISNQDDINERRSRLNEKIDNFKNRLSEKFSGEDLLKVNKALEFMLKIHLPQADRVDGEPFAVHPLAVANKVMSLSDDSNLTAAALLHDGVEDQSDWIFTERVNRKFPDREYIKLKMTGETKNRYKAILKEWSFREVKEQFGSEVKRYVEGMTNHDFYSLAEDSGVPEEDRQDFVNKLYAEHVEDIINDAGLFILKLSDLSINIDLHSLPPEGEKYKKLKRKYKGVIEAILEKLNNLASEHPLYPKKDELIGEISTIYKEQYCA